MQILFGRSIRATTRKLGKIYLLLAASVFFAVTSLHAQQPVPDQSIADLHRTFEDPPANTRIMMRWWWFGPAVQKSELARELNVMKAAGIGGVEIANIYPLETNDPARGIENLPYVSPAHLDALHFANEEAHRLRLRVDITLGSGWPFGGPAIPVTQAAGELHVIPTEIEPGITTVKVPYIGEGEKWIAGFLLPPGDDRDASHALAVKTAAKGWYTFSADSQPRILLTFVSSRTGMMVKRPSVGAEGFVLDHYDSAALQTHLKAVGDKLLSAFSDQPPYAIFSDSLEVYASDWTPDLLAEFQKRCGYNLVPYLPALVMNDGPETAAIRHDWGRTLTELADENYLEPLETWAKEHHAYLRSQTYGYPPVTLSSNRIVDLPEGEGKATFEMWRKFSDTRWAASAGHLFHRNVISSETWTWLHSPAFRATPLDMKAEADLHFLQGINQLVGHGWPYSPPQEIEPGWRMYAAAAFNDHNPWFFAMHDLTRYLQRVSYAMRLGKPVNDVAILLPNDDVWASFKARVAKGKTPVSAAGFDESGSNVTIDESMGKFLGDKLIAQLLNAGFNPDFIDADAIDSIGIPYKALILPNVDRIPIATYRKIAEFVRNGGIVIATRREPATAPGFLHAKQESAAIAALSAQLFNGKYASAKFVGDEDNLGVTLAQLTPPDMKLSPAAPSVGFFHRKLPHGDLYFVANTSNLPQHTVAHFRATAEHAELWNAFTGDVTALSNPKAIELNLAPYESQLIYFADDAAGGTPESSETQKLYADLSRDWHVTFGATGISEQMEKLVSWSDNPKTRFYSGHATYEKSFVFNSAKNASGSRFLLDFGSASPEPFPTHPGPNNMKAYLDPPVRDAAEVFVNGMLAGVVWRPPYRLDITKLLHEGDNQLRIVVGNTAINELAGQSLPDYRLLNDRYGLRFVPQGMENLQPLPSGILGGVRLLQISSAP
ncbi:MAG: glycoside hydrolase [Acidobacteriota bacterium]|nr:glycoside hydrolase [Acidobacteriota bacterium]